MYICCCIYIKHVGFTTCICTDRLVYLVYLSGVEKLQVLSIHIIRSIQYIMYQIVANESLIWSNSVLRSVFVQILSFYSE